jgi:hypothetical protein
MSRLDAMIDETTEESVKRWRDEQAAIFRNSQASYGSGPSSTTDKKPTADKASALNLPADFWEMRPVLTQIRDAAWSRRRSPDAVLGSVLARVAALTPPSVCLPPLAGGTAPLSIAVALIAKSGGGKTQAHRIAGELITCRPPGVAMDLSPGSGEGLIEAYFDMVTEDVGGKKVRVKKQTKYGALFYLDEGEALTELGERKGSTLLPVIRGAWSGAQLGNQNANREARRSLPAGRYSIGLVVAFQVKLADKLLADSAGGTPQRFEFVHASDPSIPKVRPAWPGAIEWEPPKNVPTVMTFDDAIVAEIDEASLEAGRGNDAADELDSHRYLSQMKVAGLFAILDKRFHITAADWELARRFKATSRTVRTTIVETVNVEARKRESSSIDRIVRREGAVVDDKVTRAQHRMARAIGKHVHKSDDATRRAASRATASGDRQLATVDDAIDLAVALGFVAVDGDRLLPGKAKPV